MPMRKFEERLKKGRNYSDQRIDAMLEAQAGQDEYIKM